MNLLGSHTQSTSQLPGRVGTTTARGTRLGAGRPPTFQLPRSRTVLGSTKQTGCPHACSERCIEGLRNIEEGILRWPISRKS